MAANTPNAEVLERLLIEVVGDDTNLKASLDEMVKAARAAAEQMRDALAVDLSRLQREAEGVTQSFNTAGSGLGDLSRQFQQQLGEMQAAFDKVRDAGDKSVQEFEAYRRAALEALEALRPMATAAFGSAAAFEALVQHVRTATYEQRQQRDETEKSRQSEEDLADTIKRLTNEVRSQRNLWAGMITDDAEFRESTARTRAELEALLRTVERGSDEYRKITQEIAYAQRGLDSVNQVASRGGLAWTAQIALANQFGQQLRNLGPAGNIAAGALGIVGTAFGSLQAPLTMADFHLTKILASLSRFAFIVAPMAAGLGAIAGAAGLGALTLSAAKAAQELESATHRTGLTVEGLQELQHAARSVGVPLDLLSTTMQRLQRRAADANAGNKGLQQAFRALGVTLTDGEGRMRSTEDLLGQVADGLNRVENNADRVALAFKVFDTEGGRLLPLLKEGSEGIRQLREEARELGLVVSGDTVMSLVDFQKEVETVKRQFEVLRIEVGAAFLPIMRDVLIPLLQNTVIPWLQNAATAVDNFSDAFFDTSEAGAAFRADTLKNLQAVIMLGRGVVAAAAAVAGAVQSILGIGAGVFAAGAGLREWIDSGDEIVAQRERLITAIQQQEETLARLRAGDLPPGFDPARVSEAIEQTEAQLERYRQALADFDAEFPQGAMGSIIMGFQRGSENLLDGAVNSFTVALDALEADIPAMIEAWAQGIAPRVGRAARTIGDGVGTGIGDGVEKALPGSIAFAREMVQQFTKEFENATTAEARSVADQSRREWQAVLDAMLSPFESEEATAAARLWTDRLAVEVRAGIKRPIEVFDLLTQGIATAEERFKRAVAEFGPTSDEARAALAGLQFLESWLTQFQRDFATEPLKVDVQVNVTDVSPLPTFEEVASANLSEAVQAYVAYSRQLLDTADLQARLNGVSEQTRTVLARQEAMLTSLHGRLEEGTTEWFLVGELLYSVRQRLEDVNRQLATTSPLVRFFERLRQYREDLERGRQAFQGFMQALSDTGPGAAIASLVRVTSGLRTDELLARFTGVEFDKTAAEIARLESEVAGLVDRYDALSVTERIWLGAASHRLSQLREQQKEEEEAREAVERFKDALEDWNAAVAAMGAEEDPLARRARELKEWFDAGLLSQQQFEEMQAALDAAQARLGQQSFEAWARDVASIGAVLDPVQVKLEDLDALLAAGAITAEQYAAGLELAAAAQERLAAVEAAQEAERFAQAFEAWREQVQGIGRDTDPAAVALQQLNQWFDAGKVSAEEYAAALELVAAAQERLDLQQQAREAEKAVEAWKTARGQLDDLLGIGGSQWDELRKAAKGASDAGIIGADELAKALKAIDILEVADGFRQVAAALGEVAGIVPNLAADLTEAFAMFQAGNRAGAIASAFQAATAAVRGLGAAFEDEARRGEAFFDLLIGGAATLATVLGGPALGRAVAAAGEFIKSILGDLTNGLAEIDKQVRGTAARSQYLSQELISGIAAGATRQVSRGGLLGLLGFTKSELDRDAFDAGVSIAESIAQGLAGTLLGGDFEEAWDAFIDDVLVRGVVEAFMATSLVQDAIRNAMELIQAGRSQEAAASLDQLREQFRMVWETIQGITNSMPDPEDIERSVTFSLPSATVSVLAAPQWALELQTASERMSAAGESMLTAADLMVDAFTRPLQVEVPQARGVDAARSL